ncbi:MAG: hypothetical protein H0V66_06650 [Bdellovibrionales bacterium]|nr:hypothetical protein [Bdellovibrionales bacterium]
MKKFVLVSAFALVGCSHVTLTPKVAMELPFAPELVEEMQRVVARTPAGLEVGDVEGKSPRRVYFTALYHQYLSLSNHLGVESNLNSCPQFHHDKIETDSAVLQRFSVFTSGVATASKDFFPELAFTKKFSLKDHQEEMHAEIATLCEEGVSDNYFKFDNLITHYASKKSFHSRPDSMKSVLKIPVFANYYLLKMLRPAHSITVIHPEEQKVISMTQTHWFERYVSEAHRMRSNLIKNRMVQR